MKNMEGLCIYGYVNTAKHGSSGLSTWPPPCTSVRQPCIAGKSAPSIPALGISPVLRQFCTCHSRRCCHMTQRAAVPRRCPRVDLTSPWLTPQEVAAYLHVTPRTLRRWALAGTGPPYYKIRTTVVRYHQAE